MWGDLWALALGCLSALLSLSHSKHTNSSRTLPYWHEDSWSTSSPSSSLFFIISIIIIIFKLWKKVDGCTWKVPSGRGVHGCTPVTENTVKVAKHLLLLFHELRRSCCSVLRVNQRSPSSQMKRNGAKWKRENTPSWWRLTRPSDRLSVCLHTCLNSMFVVGLAANCCHGNKEVYSCTHGFVLFPYFIFFFCKGTSSREETQEVSSRGINWLFLSHLHDCQSVRHSESGWRNANTCFPSAPRRSFVCLRLPWLCVSH